MNPSDKIYKALRVLEITTLVVLMFLVLLVVFSFPAAAQSLTPQVYVAGKDTSLCFSVEQSKQLAKIITSRQYELKELKTQADVIKTQSSQLTTKQQIILLQQEQIQLEQSKVAARDTIISGQNGALDFQQQLIDKQEKKLQGQKFKGKILIGASILAFIAGLIIG